MSCEASEQVLLMLFGELPEGDAGAVQAHLDSCPACREDLVEMGALVGRLRRSELEPVPLQLQADLATLVRGKKRPAVRPRRGLPPWGIPVLGAAAALLLAVSLGRPPGPTPAPLPPPPPPEVATTGPTPAEDVPPWSNGFALHTAAVREGLASIARTPESTTEAPVVRPGWKGAMLQLQDRVDRNTDREVFAYVPDALNRIRSRVRDLDASLSLAFE